MVTTPLRIVGAGLNPDQLWENYLYLEGRIRALEGRVRDLDFLVAQLRAARPVGETGVGPLSAAGELGAV